MTLRNRAAREARVNAWKNTQKFIYVHLSYHTETFQAFAVHPLRRRNGYYVHFYRDGHHFLPGAALEERERERVAAALSFCSRFFK